mgnify:CR=1 FL=1
MDKGFFVCFLILDFSAKIRKDIMTSRQSAKQKGNKCHQVFSPSGTNKAAVRSSYGIVYVGKFEKFSFEFL